MASAAGELIHTDSIISFASTSSTAPISGSSTMSIGSGTSNGLLQTVLPSEIEEQFALMENHLFALGTTLYKMKKLCPLLDSTPPIQALANRIEASRTNIRDDLRRMHDRLRQVAVP
jgi:hypothetical protein